VPKTVGANGLRVCKQSKKTNSAAQVAQTHFESPRLRIAALSCKRQSYNFLYCPQPNSRHSTSI
jgi:hypothetical protein